MRVQYVCVCVCNPLSAYLAALINCVCTGLRGGVLATEMVLSVTIRLMVFEEWSVTEDYIP